MNTDDPVQFCEAMAFDWNKLAQRFIAAPALMPQERDHLDELFKRAKGDGGAHQGGIHAIDLILLRHGV